MIWRDFYLRFSHRNRYLADPYERSYVEMGIGEKGLEQCAHAESRRHAKFELGGASFISSRSAIMADCPHTTSPTRHPTAPAPGPPKRESAAPAIGKGDMKRFSVSKALII